MAYEILDNRNNKDLEKGYFASLPAIQGNQFGREVYSTAIQFKDLADFLEIFPEVQRDIIPRKVASIRRYILTSNSDKLRFFSAITVTCQGHAFYDANSKRLALDVANTKLSINDGQHRFEGIRTALSQLENDFLKAKNKEKAERIRTQIDELETMIIPMVIFSGLSTKEQSQLFHDINQLAQRPSKNANIKLNQTDLFSRMSRDIADKNRYLTHFGVEREKNSIHSNNPNTVLLSTIHASLKELFKYELIANKNFLDKGNYEGYFSIANKWFDVVFNSLPYDIDTKNKYIIDKSYTLKAIFKFVAKMLLDNDNDSEELIRSTISKVDFSITNKDWTRYEGRLSEHGKLEFSGGTNGGYRAVYNILMDKVNGNLFDLDV